MKKAQAVHLGFFYSACVNSTLAQVAVNDFRKSGCQGLW